MEKFDADYPVDQEAWNEFFLKILITNDIPLKSPIR